jgi:hypothetical protein
MMNGKGANKPSVRGRGLQSVLQLMAAAGLLGACGESQFISEGTGTLFAEIDIVAKPERTNVDLTLQRAGAALEDANVVVTEIERGESKNAESRGSGEYQTSLTGYARVLSFIIAEGQDNLKAENRGPAPHIITEPANNIILDRASVGEDLTIRWTSDGTATRVIIELNGREIERIDGDPSQTNVPTASLQDGSQRVVVHRETEFPLQGATQGSRMVTRYSVDNTFTIRG